MSRQSPTSISTRIIMSSLGVPWQAWDSHRGPISQIHQWPVFKRRSPPPAISSATLSECHRMPVGSRKLLNAEPEISLPPHTSKYLIWIQDAFNPVLLATQFHIHYILLSYFVFHFTFPTPEHPPPPPLPLPCTCFPHTVTRVSHSNLVKYALSSAI